MEMPPPGKVSNFKNPEAPLGPTITAVSFTFMSLAIIAVALRLYTRFVVVKAYGWDDGKLLDISL